MKRTMNRSVCILLSALIMLTACLCGCAMNEKGFPLPVSPAQKSAFELCTAPYTNADLDKIYNYMLEVKDAEALDKKYEIECLRKDGDNYQVIYLSTDSILVLNFDQNAKFIEKNRKESIRDLLPDASYFDPIKEGDSVHIVQAVDQHSYIPFMARDEELPLISDHYTEDGYHFRYEYNDQHKIVSVSKSAV